MERWRAPRVLVTAASELYRPAGRFALHFARTKLAVDPAFAALLGLDLLANRQHILDLGCGQGLLAAWLDAARRCAQAGHWPADWPPPPPASATVRGLDRDERDVRRAQAAHLEGAQFLTADIRHAEFERADAVVILDVLHYIDYAAQLDILRRVRAALQPGGVLITRVGDAAGGPWFRFSRWLDQLVLLLRGRGLSKLYCRPVSAWQQLLAQQGFRVVTIPMSAGTPFANFLLVAHLH